MGGANPHKIGRCTYSPICTTAEASPRRPRSRPAPLQPFARLLRSSEAAQSTPKLRPLTWCPPQLLQQRWRMCRVRRSSPRSERNAPGRGRPLATRALRRQHGDPVRPNCSPSASSTVCSAGGKWPAVKTTPARLPAAPPSVRDPCGADAVPDRAATPPWLGAEAMGDSRILSLLQRRAAGGTARIRKRARCQVRPRFGGTRRFAASPSEAARCRRLGRHIAAASPEPCG
mmetsp:Transcript_17998/g.51096  ORF Transcript_17998/g.51096 Transcript_17998/m.51096 type:complete len:230 (+) Transcript_17998:615-1304(+)